MPVLKTPDCKILFVEMLLLDEMPPKRHCHCSSYIWKNGLDIKWPPMRSACPNQTKAPSKKKSSATPSFIDRQNQTSAGDSDSQFFYNIGPQGHHTCKLLEAPHKQGQI